MYRGQLVRASDRNLQFVITNDTCELRILQIIVHTAHDNHNTSL